MLKQSAYSAMTLSGLVRVSSTSNSPALEAPLIWRVQGLLANSTPGYTNSSLVSTPIMDGALHEEVYKGLILDGGTRLILDIKIASFIAYLATLLEVLTFCKICCRG